MKKIYIVPETKVREVVLQQIIALSLNSTPYNGEDVLGKEEVDLNLLENWDF